jgi:hypothetical protein
MKTKKISPPSSAPRAATTPPPPSREQIAALAHAIWEDRGRPEGSDLDNWLEAERQLKGEVRQPLAADDLPADDRALKSDAKIDPDEALKGSIEKQLDRVVPPSGPRSPTSLG